MSAMNEALKGMQVEDTNIMLQYHRFPFGIFNKKSPMGRRVKDLEEDQKFVQALFSNNQIQQLDIADIKLGDAADKNDRWAYGILEKYADKAYGFVEPMMVPGNAGFDIFPFYFVYDQTLKKLEMKIGLGTDIVESFKENQVEISDEELRGINGYNTIISRYFDNTPVVVVVILQKCPIYEYTDRAWRYSAIKKDPETMAVLKSYLDTCQYPPREDKFYFIRSKSNEDGSRYYWLEKEGRYRNRNSNDGAEASSEE